jgi:6-phosphogluconolactonase (cycloisomerase 2 family)
MHGLDVRRLGLAAALLLLVLASLAGLASARGAGNLTFKGCVHDKGPGSDACSKKADGLNGVAQLAPSPKGDSLYATGDLESAVVWLKRSKSSGKLTPKDCVEDHHGDAGCSQEEQGLGETQDVAVSPDGKSVYAVGRADDAVVRFKRKASGALKGKGCIRDDDHGDSICDSESPALGGAKAVTVSPDGRSVYVAAEFEGLSVFKRNKKTGALTPKQCVVDNDDLSDAGCDGVDGISSPQDLVVSKNGKNLYVAGGGNDAVVAFDRNKNTGKLTFVGCIQDNDSGTDSCASSANGLDNVTALALSPDQKSLYATAGNDDAISRFTRDTDTGVIAHAGCTQDNDTGTDSCSGTANGLAFANGVVVNKEGTAVFVTSRFDSAIARFVRDTGTGALSGPECVGDEDVSPEPCGDTAPGLNTVVGIAMSPQGNSLYTASVNGFVDWFKQS